MNRRELSRWVGAVLAMLGVGLMLYGANRGEIGVVLAKAVNICLECIGIG